MSGIVAAPEYGKNDKETIQILMDTVMKLRKELNFVLYHLDDENIPSLAGMKGDILGNHTAIIQTENQITLLAQDVTGAQGAITVLSNEVSLKVSNSQYTASIIVDMINNGSVTISAERINLNGVTTMNGLTQVKDTLTLGNLDNEGYLVLKNQMSIYSSGSAMKIITPSTGAVDVLTQPGFFTYNGYEVATKYWVQQEGGGTAKFG